ncbi:FKBP-type peptidyl-prolyl cis-trans isomerase [Qipengyuania sphaerica]|uniref:FKBP-type peptidyl-prolyl cis-trans isomerase n=1 Tax=Qipengyuania sphaerica TaxID=2867243 RepID=UPI001C88B685|nr:FKBP-type peptidyl-prolyl cis-trans isomerase [Qipengyuania sphaerica]MBX7539937.1 FKBP-type peptidyl-prolyl cis-trans isomerase [Qipengyuania sphaerica]
MTEITRVPLQPIKKGSLTKLWLGVIVAILLGAGLAWAAAPKAMGVEVLSEGTGESPQIGDVVFVNYVGTLDDGTEFDRSRPLPIPPGVFPEGSPLLLEEGAIIPGFLEGLKQMKKGGKYRLTIPGDQAYGAEPPPGSDIPPNADLTFEVEVVDFLAREEFEAKARQLQALMGAMGGPQGTEPAPVPAE